MTSDARHDLGGLLEQGGTRADRLARRVADLYASDPQFQGADPIPEVIEAVRRPGLRLAPLLQTLLEGYADRPALGQRARELTMDPATGRTSANLLPRFETHKLPRPVGARERARQRLAARPDPSANRGRLRSLRGFRQFRIPDR